MEGYDRGKPDINWWVQQIKDGEKDRDFKTESHMWEQWRNSYRNKFRDEIYTKNIFFLFRRMMVPKTYFRNPSISVVPKKPGLRHAALAKIMEQVFNSLLSSMQLKKELKKIVDSAFITGTGIGKLGFGAVYTPTPAVGGTEIPITARGQYPEYTQGVAPNMPIFRAIEAQHYVSPAGSYTHEDAYFQAHWVTRYRDDIRADSRFEKVRWKNRKAIPDDFRGTLNEKGVFSENSREQVDLIEIRDRRVRKVIVLAPKDTDEVLFFEDDELQTNIQSPYYFYIPNADDSWAWGVSDSRVLHSYQEQLNEIKTKIFVHARLGIKKWLYQRGSIDTASMERLLSHAANAFIEVKELSGLKDIVASEIPRALIEQERSIMEDAREVMGFSRNQLGSFQAAKSHAGHTAAEVNAVKESAELRIDERRDILSDMLVDIFEGVKTIIFRHWTQKQVINIIGKDGLPTWVEFTGEMLKEGEYEIKIEPDTAVPETKEVKFARAKSLYADLMQNPFVDIQELTRLYLRSVPGVSADRLMKGGASVLNIGTPPGAQGAGNVMPFPQQASTMEGGTQVAPAAQQAPIEQLG